MKKAFIVTATVALLTAGVLAEAVTGLSIVMSTPGPDTYADGTAVLAGETYLLVYCNAGSDFAGVYNDGTLVETLNNRIAFAWQTETPGQCSYIPVSYRETDYPAGGSWMIVLLDTRDAQGRVGGLCVGVGAGAATSSSSVQSMNTMSSVSAEGSAVQASSAAYAHKDTPKAIITALKPEGDKVGLRFKNFADNVSYTVESTTDLASGQWVKVADRIDSASRPVLAGADGAPEISAEVPVTGSASTRFFRVVVPNVAE